MRTRSTHLFAVVTSALLWSAVPAVAQTKPAEPSAAPAGKAPVNADAAALKDFTDRVAKYVSLHEEAVKTAPPQKQTTEPAEILNAQKALAAAIRAKRADAKPGDIFTPEIRAQFRRLLSPTVKGEDGQDAKAILKDDAPVNVPLKVNSDYPEGKTLPTVPAKVLLNLPTLPKTLEYRFVDKHLILRDTPANIIVDYIPNALP